VNRRNAILIGASLGLAFAFACSFPDVTYAPSSGGTSGAGTSGGTSSGGTSGSGISEAGKVVDVEPDDVDKSTCGDKCDCDGDDYLKPNCIPDAGEDVRNKKDGGDCVDFDKNANPGVDPASYIDLEPRDHPGDWNCDGRVDKLYPVITSCSNDLICNATEGFRFDVGCGVESTIVKCGRVNALSACAPLDVEPRKQACR
jgi:hypothetical protein